MTNYPIETSIQLDIKSQVFSFSNSSPRNTSSAFNNNNNTVIIPNAVGSVLVRSEYSTPCLVNKNNKSLLNKSNPSNSLCNYFDRSNFQNNTMLSKKTLTCNLSKKKLSGFMERLENDIVFSFSPIKFYKGEIREEDEDDDLLKKNSLIKRASNHSHIGLSNSFDLNNDNRANMLESQKQSKNKDQFVEKSYKKYVPENKMKEEATTFCQGPLEANSNIKGFNAINILTQQNKKGVKRRKSCDLNYLGNLSKLKSSKNRRNLKTDQNTNSHIITDKDLYIKTSLNYTKNIINTKEDEDRKDELGKKKKHKKNKSLDIGFYLKIKSNIQNRIKQRQVETESTNDNSNIVFNKLLYQYRNKSYVNSTKSDTQVNKPNIEGVEKNCSLSKVKRRVRSLSPSTLQITNLNKEKAQTPVYKKDFAKIIKLYTENGEKHNNNKIFVKDKAKIFSNVNAKAMNRSNEKNKKRVNSAVFIRETPTKERFEVINTQHLNFLSKEKVNVCEITETFTSKFKKYRIKLNQPEGGNLQVHVHNEENAKCSGIHVNTPNVVISKNNSKAAFILSKKLNFFESITASS